MKATHCCKYFVIFLLVFVSLACGIGRKEVSDSDGELLPDNPPALNAQSDGEKPQPQPGIEKSSQPPMAAETGWRIFSNVNEIYGLVYDNGSLFAATLGGAAQWDLTSGEAVKYTPLDGMRHISAFDIAVCSIPDKRIVFATEYGLSFLDPVTGAWDNKQITPDESNLDGARINKIFCDEKNKRLLISAYGIGVLDLQSGEYTRYSKDQGLQWDSAGGFDVSGDDIWVASGYKYVSLIHDGKVTSYDKESGFPAETAYSVAIDPRGVAWVSVDTGLAAFDNGAWKLFKDVENLPSGAMDLAVTSDGKIWLGNHSKVCLFNPDTISCEVVVENPLGASIFGVTLDDNDNPYFATQQGILALKGDLLEPMIFPGEKLADNYVPAIGQDAQGMIWVATDSGAQRFDPSSVDSPWDLFKYDSADPEGPCGTSFNGVFPQANGSVWLSIGTSRGCGYDGKKWTTYGKDQGMVGSSISSMAVDSKGSLWVSTNEGVNIWDGSSTRTLGEADGLPAKTVRTLFVDGDTLWIGTTAGLASYQGGALKTVLKKDNAPSSDAANVKQIVKEPSGTYLLATPAGIVRWNGSQAELIFKPEPISGLFGIPTTSISALALGADGHIWAGTYAGVYHFDGTQWEQITPENGLPANNVNTLLIDRAGALWVGAGYTNSGGALARYIFGGTPPGTMPPGQGQPEEQPALPDGSGDVSNGGLPVMDGAEGLIETETTLNYSVDANLTTVRDYYLAELPRLGWVLDVDENGKCRDNDRCMGWHGDYSDPATTTWFFLQGEHAYLTLNLIPEGGKQKVVLMVDPKYK